jgi:DNA-binding MarR family transcriptional regulator
VLDWGVLIMTKRIRNTASLDEIVVHLLHRVSQRADDLFNKEAGDSGMTPRQFAVLLAAARSEGPSQTDLVNSTGIDRSTVAELIKRMLKKGLLQRRRSRRDTRAYVVRLTETGQSALKAAEPQAQRAGVAVLASLSGEQRKVLIEALKSIANS